MGKEYFQADVRTARYARYHNKHIHQSGADNFSRDSIIILDGYHDYRNLRVARVACNRGLRNIISINLMENKKEQKKRYLICDSCKGSGKQQFNRTCPECSGAGLDLIFNGKAYYWNMKLGQILLGSNYLKVRLQGLLNLFGLLFGCGGMIAFAFWLFEYEKRYIQSGILFFWQDKHWQLLFFWIGVLALMFIYYRVNEEKSLKPKIKKIINKEKQWFDPMLDWQSLKKFKGMEKINVADGYGFKAVEAIENSFLLAKKMRHERIEPAHLFFCLLQDSEVKAIFSRLDADPAILSEKIKNQLSKINASGNLMRLAEDTRKALIESYLQAESFSQPRVKPRNLILPLIEKDEIIKEILLEQEIDEDKILNTISWFRIHEQLLENYRNYKKMARFKPASVMDRAYTAIATPFLNSFSYDLTSAAKWSRLEFCASREQEIAEIFKSLEAGKNGVLLVGEPGVGKKTIIYGIAQLMVKEEVPEFFQDKRLVELDVSRLVSGASPSEAQERLLTIINEIARAGNIVLFINDIETITGISSGEEESLDLADVLVNALDHHGLYCLATASVQNYANHLEDKPLDQAMHKIKIEEPVGNQAIIIIESKIGLIEGKHQVYFSYGAIEEAVKLSSKYIHEKYLPIKAIEILESLAAKKSKMENKFITKEDVAGELSAMTGIPISKVTESEGRELLNLEERIHEHMINQEEAVDMVAASLRRARAQLSEGKRPIVSFLFLGPTGVGKTELAKSVAKVYFGDEHCMIRIDMSEYQNQDSVNKMIGGADSKGYLTEAIRKAPFSLLLLDEFEKAHPDILNLFLQVMDDGRLTDGQGRTIDFTNCIIIATSNAGAVYIQEQIGRGTPIEKIKEVLINEQLNKIMRPELINRFDGIIVFKPLSEDDVSKITRLMLGKTAKTLEGKGIRLNYDEAGVNVLAKAGFDPKFGARPLRRLLQDRIENIIANKILAGEIKRRDTVLINEDGEVMVEKAKAL